MWRRALHMLQDCPFTVIWAGTFQLVADALYPFFVARPDDVPARDPRRRYGAPGYWWVAAPIVAISATVGHGASARLGGERAFPSAPPVAPPSIPTPRSQRCPTIPSLQLRLDRTLEIAAFSTTRPITDLVNFCMGVLAEGGWDTDIQGGDATSWGGNYTHDEGRSIRLLDVLGSLEGPARDIAGEVWTSVVCGDRFEPLHPPPVSAQRAPMANLSAAEQ